MGSDTRLVEERAPLRHVWLEIGLSRVDVILLLLILCAWVGLFMAVGSWACDLLRRNRDTRSVR